MAETEPLKVQVSSTDGPSSQIMQDTPALLIRQDLDIGEIFCPACQKRNKYKISALKDLNDEDFNGKWTDKQFKSLPKLMKAKEKSTFLCRLCCMKWREFDMDVTSKDTDETVYTFHRPFKCTLLCCCMLINPQEIQVNDKSGATIGKATQDWRCFDALCCAKVYWKTENAEGEVQHIIRDDLCCPRSFNQCAPSCFCKVHNLDIYEKDTEGEPVGQLENIWPGCNIRACCGSADSYKLVFPPNATEEQRALILANMMLIEYMMFEKSGEDA